MNVFIHEAGSVRRSHGAPFTAIPCTIGFFPLKLRDNMGNVTTANPNAVDRTQTLIVSGWIRPASASSSVEIDLFDTAAKTPMVIALPPSVNVNADGMWTIEFPPPKFASGETYTVIVGIDGCTPASISFKVA
jgi:hypothetical protein